MLSFSLLPPRSTLKEGLLYKLPCRERGKVVSYDINTLPGSKPNALFLQGECQLKIHLGEVTFD